MYRLKPCQSIGANRGATVSHRGSTGLTKGHTGGSSPRTVYHGGVTDVPGVVPVYHGIWQPFPVYVLKQPGTWAGSTRFIPVWWSGVNRDEPWSSQRFIKVVHGAATIVTRSITVHPGSPTVMDRVLISVQWERGFTYYTPPHF